MESVAQFLKAPHSTAFSFEILPPVRGKSIDGTYADIEQLMEFNPAYVNITTHRSDVSYKQMADGTYREVTTKRRPGTVAIAAVIKERFKLRPVPHIICGNYSRREIEDQLIDLSYLGITDVLALRGDRSAGQTSFTTSPDGHIHALNLEQQIVDFNNGVMADGTSTAPMQHPFSFGVAGYPEKHDEAMNLSTDLQNLKAKVDAGAEYVVTQMFFDNAKYFDFVNKAREIGITVPIIPGLKPLTSLRQLSLLPRVFHIDYPEELAKKLLNCTSDEQVKQVGIDWAVKQANELKEANVASIHFYSMHAVKSVAEIARQVYDK